MHHPLPTLVGRSAAVLLVTSSLALAQWLQKAPATSPSARSGAAMTYDGASGTVLLFGGGLSGGVGSPLISAETWTYDGDDWTLQAPLTSPSARSGAQLVYDSARGVSVLYGGLATSISVPPPNSDTWEWNGTNWTQATPLSNPGPRYRYGMCFDSVRNRTVLYGGTATQLLSPPNSQTWEYNGNTWTLVATTGNPGGRDRPAMCFHAGLARTVLFGGSSATGLTDSTWLYDGTTWTQVTIAGPRPSPRNAAAMVYDATRNLCVLVGGQNSLGSLGDTWTFDGVAWTEQPTTTTSVRDHSLAFLPGRNQVVKFGGFVAAPNVLTNETWELGSGVYGRGCAGTAGVPSLTAAGAPQIGQSYTLTATNLNPALSFGFLAIGLTQLPGLDLTAVLSMPGCFAFASADVILGITGSGGSASFSWSPVGGVVGQTFYAQALCLDPTVNPFGFTISNAVYATIGN